MSSHGDKLNIQPPPEGKILSHWLGDIVDSGIGLSGPPGYMAGGPIQ
jgi:hypothetical protein